MATGNGKHCRWFEYNRCVATPERWYDYCNKMLSKRGVDIEDWMEKDAFIDYKFGHCNDRCSHEDWDEPQLEICRLMPCDVQLYLEGDYNFIMEWDDGRGYMYLWESRERSEI